MCIIANQTIITVRLDRETCEYTGSHTTYIKDTILTAQPQSANPQDRVFALIRSRTTAAKLEALAAQRKNIHIVVTDMYDPAKLDQTAAEVSQITGGSLDVLVLNAGSAEPETSVLPPSAL